MMRATASLLLILAITCTAAAQRPRGGRGGMAARFEQNSPKIGAQLPDISAYDENGKKLKLRSLRGHYSVLVFGCLT